MRVSIGNFLNHGLLSFPLFIMFLAEFIPVATCIFIKLKQYKDLYSSQVLWQNSLWDKHQQKFLLVFFFFCLFAQMISFYDTI